LANSLVQYQRIRKLAISVLQGEYLSVRSEVITHGLTIDLIYVFAFFYAYTKNSSL